MLGMIDVLPVALTGAGCSSFNPRVASTKRSLSYVRALPGVGPMLFKLRLNHQGNSTPPSSSALT